MAKKQTYGPGKLKLSASEKIKILLPYVSDRFLIQVKSVWLIIAYLLLFQLIVLQLPIVFALQIAVGISVVIIGLMFFMEGLTLGLMPFGEIIGAVLPKKAPIPGLLLFAFIIGIGATFAEPAISVLQAAGKSISPKAAPLLYDLLNDYSLVLVIAVGVGVGIAVIFGMLRFLYSWSLKILIFPLIIILSILTIIALLIPETFAIIGLAWDCGAVTTGPVTVPLVLALGIGVCRVVGSSDAGSAGFGVVTLASLFPILAVLGLSFVLYAMDSEGKYKPEQEREFSAIVEDIGQITAELKEPEITNKEYLQTELEKNVQQLTKLLSHASQIATLNHEFRFSKLKEAFDKIIYDDNIEELASPYWRNVLVPIINQYEIESYESILSRIGTKKTEIQNIPGDRELFYRILSETHKTLKKLRMKKETALEKNQFGEKAPEPDAENNEPVPIKTKEELQQEIQTLEQDIQIIKNTIGKESALEYELLRSEEWLNPLLRILGSYPIQIKELSDTETSLGEKAQQILDRIDTDSEKTSRAGDKDRIRQILKKTHESIRNDPEQEQVILQAWQMASEEKYSELQSDEWKGKVGHILEQYKAKDPKALLEQLANSTNKLVRISAKMKLQELLENTIINLKATSRNEHQLLNEALIALKNNNVSLFTQPRITSQIRPIVKTSLEPNFQTILMRIGTEFEKPEDKNLLVNTAEKMLQRTGDVDQRDDLQKVRDQVTSALKHYKSFKPEDEKDKPTINPSFGEKPEAYTPYAALQESPELIKVNKVIKEIQAGKQRTFKPEEVERLRLTGELPEGAVIASYQGKVTPQENKILIQQVTLGVESLEEQRIDTENLRAWNTAPKDSSEEVGVIIVDAAIGAVRAILPLIVFLALVLLVFLREKIKHPDEIILGVLFAVIGMWLFTIGIGLGLTPLGDQVGSNLPSAFSSILPQPLNGGIDGIHGPLFGEGLGYVVAIIFAFLLGYAATLAEPALNVLGATVEKITVGAFKKSLLMQAVAIGVGTGLGFGIVKLAFNVPLPYLLIPPYMLLLVLTALSSETFVNIGWDSAGVTTGPITVPLVLAMGLGIGSQVNVLEGFGVLAMASVMPILSVLTVGLLVTRGAKKQESSDGGAQNA